MYNKVQELVRRKRRQAYSIAGQHLDFHSTSNPDGDVYRNTSFELTPPLTFTHHLMTNSCSNQFGPGYQASPLTATSSFDIHSPPVVQHHPNPPPAPAPSHLNPTPPAPAPSRHLPLNPTPPANIHSHHLPVNQIPNAHADPLPLNHHYMNEPLPSSGIDVNCLISIEDALDSIMTKKGNRQTVPSTVAQALAKLAIFGVDVMRKCTPSGSSMYPARTRCTSSRRPFSMLPQVLAFSIWV